MARYDQRCLGTFIEQEYSFRMRIDVHIHWADDELIGLVRTILSKQETMMAAIDDELAGIKVALDTIGTGVTALLAKIAAMPTAGLTPAQQAALDAIAAEAQGIATAANPAT